jgi:cation transport regulator ChaC
MSKPDSPATPRKSAPRKTPMALTEALVARTLRAVEDSGPTPGMVYMTDADYARFRDEVLAAAPAGPLKLFAYGSLLWKPVGEVTGGERAVATGWHRSFCFTVQRFRGTVDRPGLMMALDRGGQCQGMVFEIAEPVAANLEALLRREMTILPAVNVPRWLNVRTGGAPRGRSASSSTRPIRAMPASSTSVRSRRRWRPLSVTGGRVRSICSRPSATSTPAASATAICGNCRSWWRRRSEAPGDEPTSTLWSRATSFRGKAGRHQRSVNGLRRRWLTEDSRAPTCLIRPTAQKVRRGPTRRHAARCRGPRKVRTIAAMPPPSPGSRRNSRRGTR